ncbi:hypothetical protein OAK38_04915 [Verrucomicrobia bacterium]|nr:hypothetical protein [Verrucomicrobiota bacterium]
MTKISFDVDFSEDPEKILQQIQDRAKAEVEKRESKERVSGYLSKLHEKVNEDINTDYKSATDLIKALTPFASPALKDKLSSTSPSGRRKTVSMNKDVFDEIKKLLAEPNPNKAAIGRETGVSVVQVRKVADGGYDEKFGGEAPSTPTEKPADKDEDSFPEPDLPPPSFGNDEPADEPPAPPAPDLPEPPSFGDDEPADELPAPPAPDLPEPPSFGDDEPADELPAPPAPDLPEPPSFGGDDLPAPPAPDLPEPPSFGDDEPADEPPAPPAPDLPEPPSFGDDDPADEPPAPPAPDLPEPPSFGDDEPADEPPAPPAPPSLGDDEPADELPAPPAPGKPGLTRPPSLGAGKPTLKTGKPGKPSLSLKKGKSKTKGMKITRPPHTRDSATA